MEATLTPRDKKLLYMLGFIVILFVFGWVLMRPIIKSITKTDEDLLSAIYALESGEIHNESRIERFRNKYLTYENNDSSRKVFQKVFVEGYIEKNVARNLRIKAVVKRILPKKLFDRLRELRNTQKI